MPTFPHHLYVRAGKPFGPAGFAMTYLSDGPLGTCVEIRLAGRLKDAAFARLEAIRAFAQDPQIEGVLPLVHDDPGEGVLVYALQGRRMVLCERLEFWRTVKRPKAAKEFFVEGLALLQRAANGAEERGVEHHGSLNPWTIAVRIDDAPGERLALLCYGLTPFEDTLDASGAAKSPAGAYLQPEHVGLTERFTPLHSELYSLALIAAEIGSGKRVLSDATIAAKGLKDALNGVGQADLEAEMDNSPLAGMLAKFLAQNPTHRPTAVRGLNKLEKQITGLPFHMWARAQGHAYNKVSEHVLEVTPPEGAALPPVGPTIERGDADDWLTEGDTPTTRVPRRRIERDEADEPDSEEATVTTDERRFPAVPDSNREPPRDDSEEASVDLPPVPARAAPAKPAPAGKKPAKKPAARAAEADAPSTVRATVLVLCERGAAPMPAAIAAGVAWGRLAECLAAPDPAGAITTAAAESPADVDARLIAACALVELGAFGAASELLDPEVSGPWRRALRLVLQGRLHLARAAPREARSAFLLAEDAIRSGSADHTLWDAIFRAYAVDLQIAERPAEATAELARLAHRLAADAPSIARRLGLRRVELLLAAGAPLTADDDALLEDPPASADSGPLPAWTHGLRGLVAAFAAHQRDAEREWMVALHRGPDEGVRRRVLVWSVVHLLLSGATYERVLQELAELAPNEPLAPSVRALIQRIGIPRAGKDPTEAVLLFRALEAWRARAPKSTEGVRVDLAGLPVGQDPVGAIAVRLVLSYGQPLAQSTHKRA